MNEILNRIDEFLSEREEKEKYMIYASLLIVFIIIYYYFNYGILYKKIKEEKASLEATRKSYDLKSYERKLFLKRNEYINLNKRIKTIKKDLKEINYLIKNAMHPKLIIKEDEVFSFLKDLFRFSISKYLFPSYQIDKNSSNLRTFSIKLKGQTDIRNFNNFINFLGFMEKSNFITNLSRVEFNFSIYPREGKVSDYNATLDIWSYR